VVGVLVAIGHQLRSGGIVAPPMFASTLLFGLGVIAVIVLGASPLHLLGWFPLSLVLGIVVLTFPAGVTSPGLVWVCWPNSNPGRTLRPNADNT
jgi:hypothetical protein